MPDSPALSEQTQLQDEVSLKTSEQWFEIYKVENGDCHITDPDGWDRTNFDYSWFEEEISFQDFEQRMARSTALILTATRPQ